MQVDDLGSDDGLEGIKLPTQTLLVDADTIAYAAATGCRYPEEVLAQHFYTDEEWEAIISHDYYDANEECIWHQDVDKAVEVAIENVHNLIAETETKDAELYFTAGRNFRYTVDPMYKANRSDSDTPPKLREIKEGLLNAFKGEICTSIEADDAVVYLKRTHPKKYVLCAVDKDVLNSVPGEHYNYYRSEKWKIQPKWVIITPDHAKQWFYKQILMGDTTDNIQGCPGIGPKKAEKALAKAKTSYEMWQVVVKLYQQKNLTVKDAISTARLVGMHQVYKDDAGQWRVDYWIPPMEDKHE